MEGEGKCQYTDDSVYTGSWLNNLRHGYGEHKFANGYLYKGEF